MRRSGRSGTETGPSLGVRLLRAARSLHGSVSLGLFGLVIISSATGILLGWKKNSATLQPPTQRAAGTRLEAWRPLSELAATASLALAEELDAPAQAQLVPDRIDVRPADGIVKVLFPAAWEVQVEGGTGAVRSVGRRHSDWIEKIHDGSIISDGFKLISMNVLGFGLLVLSTSGLWMWYGPLRLRRIRAKSRPERSRAA